MGTSGFEKERWQCGVANADETRGDVRQGRIIMYKCIRLMSGPLALLHSRRHNLHDVCTHSFTLLRDTVVQS